ncbi:MAG: hypothetical protein ACQEVT_13575 [Pseudomonadota bacterium]
MNSESRGRSGRQGGVQVFAGDEDGADGAVVAHHDECPIEKSFKINSPERFLLYVAQVEHSSCADGDMSRDFRITLAPKAMMDRIVR